MIKRCALVLAAGVVAAALSSAPPASATVAWVVASASPSTNKFDFSPGSTSDEAQQNAEQLGYSAAGLVRGEGSSDCVTDF
jgi:hypothetical protein